MKPSFHEPTSNIGFFPLSKHPVRKKEGSTNVQSSHPPTWVGAEVLAPEVQPSQLCSAAASSLQHQKKQFSAQIYPLSPRHIHTKESLLDVSQSANWVMFCTSQGSPSGFCAVTEMKLIIHVTTAKILFQGLALPFCSSKPLAEVKIFLFINVCIRTKKVLFNLLSKAKKWTVNIKILHGLRYFKAQTALV